MNIAAVAQTENEGFTNTAAVEFPCTMNSLYMHPAKCHATVV